MKPVTDPAILAQLNARPDVPPETLAQLNAPFEFSALETLKNVPGDAKRVGGQMLDAAMSPIQTLNAVKNFTIGVAQKAWPGEQDYEKYADVVWQSLVDSYGSPEKALRSLQERPVETALDALTLVSGGAGLVRGAATGVAKIPAMQGAGNVADIAGKVQAVSDPFNMAKRGVQAGVAAVRSNKAPQEMYLSAVKPYKKFTDAERTSAAQTALNEQIMPTPGGLRRLDKKMVELGDKIDNLISTAENTGKKVQLAEVSRAVRELRDKWKKSPRPEALKDVAILERYMDDFAEQLQKQGNLPLSPSQLQEIKTDLYRKINFHRKQNTTSLPLEDVQKALARGTRESIEGIVPEIADVNRQYGDLSNLRDILDGPVARIQNRDMVGIGVPIKMSAGSLLTGDYGVLGGAAGGLLGVLDAPTNKARAALALHRWGTQPLMTPANVPAGLLWYNASQLPVTE